MKNCERHELALSCLIDDELDAVEVAPTLDHLVECDPCRTFYRMARRLEAAALDSKHGAPTLSPTVAVADDGMWDRIRQTAAQADSPATPARGPRPVWQQWASVAASTILVALGVGMVLWMMPTSPSDANDPMRIARSGDSGTQQPIRVVLGQDPGKMTDKRFVEVTTELLQADRRYRDKMFEVMQAVTRDGFSREGRDEAPPVTTTPENLRRALEDRGADLIRTGLESDRRM